MRYALPLVPASVVPDVDVAIQLQPLEPVANLSKVTPPKPKRDTSAVALNGLNFFRKALPMAVGFAIGLTLLPTPVEGTVVPPCVDIVYADDTFTDADGTKLQLHTGEIHATYVIPYQVETGFTDIDYEIVDGTDLTGSGFSPGSENDRIAWFADPFNATDYSIIATVKFMPAWTLGTSFAQMYLLARGTNQHYFGSGGLTPSPDADRAYFEFGTGGGGNMSAAFGPLSDPISSLTPTFRDIDFTALHKIELRVEGNKATILVDDEALIGPVDTSGAAGPFIGFMTLDDQDDFGTFRITELKVIKKCEGPTTAPPPPPVGTTLFLEDCSDTGTADGRTPAVGGEYTDPYSDGLTRMTFGSGVSPIEHPSVYAASTITPPGEAYTLSFKFNPSTVAATDQTNLDYAVRRESDDSWAVELYVAHDFSDGLWKMCPFVALASGYYSPGCIDITAHVNVGAVNTAEVAISATGSVWKVNGATVASDSGVPGFTPDGVIWTNDGINNLGGSPTTHVDVSEVKLVSN